MLNDKANVVGDRYNYVVNKLTNIHAIIKSGHLKTKLLDLVLYGGITTCLAFAVCFFCLLLPPLLPQGLQYRPSWPRPWGSLAACSPKQDHYYPEPRNIPQSCAPGPYWRGPLLCWATSSLPFGEKKDSVLSSFPLAFSYHRLNC